MMDGCSKHILTGRVCASLFSRPIEFSSQIALTTYQCFYPLPEENLPKYLKSLKLVFLVHFEGQEVVFF